MINKLRSKKFYNKPFQLKKFKLEKFLLKHGDCTIGDTLLCFEDRELQFDYRFAGKNTQPEKRISFTVGNIYKVLDKKKGKIKIKNDKSNMVWTTVERFLGQKALRKMKLDELNKVSKTRKLYIE